MFINFKKKKREKEDSEFPPNFFDKHFKKINLILSPILLLSLLIVVIIDAEGYQLDTKNNEIIQSGGVEIKEIVNANVVFNGKSGLRAPILLEEFDTVNDSVVELYKTDRRDWKKTVKIDSGIVKTYYPILFPKNISFSKSNLIDDDLNIVEILENDYLYDSTSTFFIAKTLKEIKDNSDTDDVNKTDDDEKISPTDEIDLNQDRIDSDDISEGTNINNVNKADEIITTQPSPATQSLDLKTERTSLETEIGSDEDLILYEYKVERTIFGFNDSIEEISNLSENIDELQEDPNIELILQKDKVEVLGDLDYDLYPSPDGSKILLVINNIAAGIIESEKPIARIPNFIPNENINYMWSSNNNDLAIINGSESINIFNTSERSNYVIYPNNTKEETFEVQFITNDSIFFIIREKNKSFLYSNNLRGSKQIIIDIPNIDNVLNGNLEKTFSFLSENSLIIQTKENIFLYEVLSGNLKKINSFPNEKVAYIDQDEELILFFNRENLNQLRLFDLDKSSNIRSYSLIDNLTFDENNFEVFNSSQNAVLSLGGSILFFETDGQNQFLLENEIKDSSVLQAIRVGEEVQILISEKIQGSYELKFLRFTN